MRIRTAKKVGRGNTRKPSASAAEVRIRLIGMATGTGRVNRASAFEKTPNAGNEAGAELRSTYERPFLLIKEGSNAIRFGTGKSGRFRRHIADAATLDDVRRELGIGKTEELRAKKILTKI